MSVVQWVEITDGVVVGPDLGSENRVGDVYMRAFEQVGGVARVNEYPYAEREPLTGKFYVAVETEYLSDRDDESSAQYTSEILDAHLYEDAAEAERAAQQFAAQGAPDQITWDGVETV